MANLQGQTQGAIDQLNTRIEAVNAAAQDKIVQLADNQNQFAHQTNNRLKALQDQIDATQKNANGRIAALTDLVDQIQKNGAARDAALANLIGQIKQNNASQFAAVGQQLDNINGDLHSLNNRVSLLEQQMPQQAESLEVLKHHVMNLEARLQDAERAIGYLLSIH